MVLPEGPEAAIEAGVADRPARDDHVQTGCTHGPADGIIISGYLRRPPIRFSTSTRIAIAEPKQGLAAPKLSATMTFGRNCVLMAEIGRSRLKPIGYADVADHETGSGSWNASAGKGF